MVFALSRTWSVAAIIIINLTECVNFVVDFERKIGSHHVANLEFFQWIYCRYHCGPDVHCLIVDTYYENVVVHGWRNEGHLLADDPQGCLDWVVWKRVGQGKLVVLDSSCQLWIWRPYQLIDSCQKIWIAWIHQRRSPAMTVLQKETKEKHKEWNHHVDITPGL